MVLQNIKNKEILKATREKTDYQPPQTLILLTPDFSIVVMEPGRQLNVTINVLEKGSYQCRILLPIKLSFKNEGKIKTFQLNKLITLVTNRLSIKEILKD